MSFHILLAGWTGAQTQGRVTFTPGVWGVISICENAGLWFVLGRIVVYLWSGGGRCFVRFERQASSLTFESTSSLAGCDR